MVVSGGPHCHTLLHTATHCNTLQHTVTHCTTATDLEVDQRCEADGNKHDEHVEGVKKCEKGVDTLQATGRAATQAAPWISVEGGAAEGARW